MKKSICLLCTVTLFFILVSNFVNAGISTATREKNLSNSYAVLVGINEYCGVKNGSLCGCVNDVEAFNEVLIGQGVPFGNITKLISDRKSNSATHNLILSAIQDMASKASKYSTIIFMFSGHSMRYGLTPSDVFFNDLKAENTISFDQIIAPLLTSKAENKWIFIDSHVNIDFSKYPKDFLKANGFMIIQACSKEGEQAHEIVGINMGCFTKVLVEGFSKNGDLNSDGKLTLKEVMDYVQKEVPAYTKEKMNREQTPIIWGEIPDMILKFVENVIPETNQNTGKAGIIGVKSESVPKDETLSR